MRRWKLCTRKTPDYGCLNKDRDFFLYTGIDRWLEEKPAGLDMIHCVNKKPFHIKKIGRAHV